MPVCPRHHSSFPNRIAGDPPMASPVHVDAICLFRATPGPADFGKLRAYPSPAKPPPSGGYFISSTEDLERSMNHACQDQFLEWIKADGCLVYWPDLRDSNKGEWAPPTVGTDLPKAVMKLAMSGDKQFRKYLLVAPCNPTPRQGISVEVEVYQSGLDHIGARRDEMQELVAGALNGARQCREREGTVLEHFRLYTEPAFKLRAKHDLECQEVLATHVSVVDKYGRIRFEAVERNSCVEELRKATQGTYVGKLDPRRFEIFSDTQPYQLQAQDYGGGTLGMLALLQKVRRRGDTSLAIIAVRPSGSQPPDYFLRMKFDRAFKAGCVYLDFVEVGPGSAEAEILKGMLPTKLRDFFGLLHKKEAFVLVTDGKDDCSWCQLFPASSLVPDRAFCCCVPCAQQIYPRKMGNEIFGDKEVDSRVSCGVQEELHAWNWIQSQEAPTPLLSEMQLDSLRPRLEMLGHPDVTGLLAVVCLAFSILLVAMYQLMLYLFPCQAARKASRQGAGAVHREWRTHPRRAVVHRPAMAAHSFLSSPLFAGECD